MVQSPPFTVGIEEEYLLVDRVTRNLVADPPPEFMAGLKARLDDQVSPELLRCQVEVGTRPASCLKEAARELKALRRAVVEAAAAIDAAPVAASTHPFADWTPQRATDKERYTRLFSDIGAPAQRMLICGQHVHVGLGDDALRIDLMNQVRYFLPHLLCLSTSSPFWRGRDTGLMSYRLAAFDEMPRTGLPEPFYSFGEYQRHVALLVDNGIIEDASKLWWDIRPSARFPTLELRICDVSTRVDDAITVAALYVSLLRHLWRLKTQNLTWRRYSTMLIAENRWRAQRYGSDGSLLDFGRSTLVPYAELLSELVELVREDAEALGCAEEVARAPAILARGTSAHRQRATFAEARERGADEPKALCKVVDWLVEETAAGL
jgi:carboxylate-amine ligase